MITNTLNQDEVRPTGNLVLNPHVLEWADGSGRVPAEIGRISVPESRSTDDSRLIDLRFIRIRSTAPNPGPPLFYLAGGPGSSGIEHVAILSKVIPDLLKVGDIIALDQRGVGRSVPRLTSIGRIDLPFADPLTREAFIADYGEQSRIAAEYWRNVGVDLNAYNTSESAADIDALRTALGEERINLLGASYGSHLGLVIVREHGAHVHRACLGLIEGPDHTFKLPSRIQDHLEALNELLQRDDSIDDRVRPFIPQLHELTERLSTDPATTVLRDGPFAGASVTLGDFDIRLIAAQGLGATQFIRQLPSRVLQGLDGDLTWWAQHSVTLRRSWLGSAMTHAMDLASGASPVRRERIADEAKRTVLQDMIDFPLLDVSDAWQITELDDHFRRPVESDVAVLLFSGTLDARTPVANAVEVARGLPNSSHIVIDGLGHESFLAYSDHLDTVTRFLAGGDIESATTSVPFSFTPE